MRVFVGIPARMASSRFPGKPLAPIAGMPMIEHVYRRCTLAEGVDKVFVAGCDAEVLSAIEQVGGMAIDTDPAIHRPALRVFAAAQSLDPADDDIVVTVQGDEPLIHPKMIQDAVQALLDNADVFVSNIVTRIETDEDWQDPNNVKVVTDGEMNAIYMSRSPIPSTYHEEVRGPRYLQVAVMPFRWHFFKRFNALEAGQLEKAESVEMLRAIEHGFKVRMVFSERTTLGVDTPRDLETAEKLLEDDPVFRLYS